MYSSVVRYRGRVKRSGECTQHKIPPPDAGNSTIVHPEFLHFNIGMLPSDRTKMTAENWHVSLLPAATSCTREIDDWAINS